MSLYLKTQQTFCDVLISLYCRYFICDISH